MRERTQVAVAYARLKRAGLGKKMKGHKSEAMRCCSCENVTLCRVEASIAMEATVAQEEATDSCTAAAAVRSGHFSDWKEVSFDWLPLL